MNAEVELLPCPFCGGTEIHFGPMDASSAWEYWVVGCNNYDCPLDADSVKVEFGTPEKAAAAWNTRATDANLAALQAEIEKLREALAALKAENEMLREALKDADNELGWLDEDIGTCDHSVGVCVCGYWNMRRKMSAALTKENSDD